MTDSEEIIVSRWSQIKYDFSHIRRVKDVYKRKLLYTVSEKNDTGEILHGKPGKVVRKCGQERCGRTLGGGRKALVSRRIVPQIIIILRKSRAFFFFYLIFLFFRFEYSRNLSII